MKKVLVTGCCGFIGSHMTDYLLKKNYKVIGLDNLSTGNAKFIIKAKKNKNFKFVKIDLLKNTISKYFKGVDIVFHFAANADVRYGLQHRFKDIEQNIIVTHNILESIIKNKVSKIAFSSTGSVYGEPSNFPTKENNNFPIQTSLYGSSKLSAEGLITSYCKGYKLKSYIFRFVSILGERYSHGHVYDFVKKLSANKKVLKILGDGNQKKSYLNVKDCINGIFKSINYFKNDVNIINLGTEEYINVKDSAKIISKKLSANPKLLFAGGKRGWVGDSPFILLDIKKAKKSGWRPKYSIRYSIKETANYLVNNKWL
tara:strand:- start:953 stop:1894 length:942 start_codon:yes stop_codon:yes gene_type:complete